MIGEDPSVSVPKKHVEFVVTTEQPLNNVGSDGGCIDARCGLVVVNGGVEVETPSLLLHTVRGCSPNVTWDGLQRVYNAIVAQSGDATSINNRIIGWGIQADVLHVCDHKKETLEHLMGQENSKKRGRDFFGYPRMEDGAVLVATPRDPCFYDYIGCVKNTTDERVSMMTMNGASSIRPEEYMEYAGFLDADIVVALGDEIVSDSKTARIISSSQRTIEWMKKALDGKNASGCQGAMLLCPIVGGGTVALREDACKYIQDCVEQADGVYISGLGTGESVSCRLEIMDLVRSRVAPEKLRMVSGVNTPGEVLQAVARGMDMFDTSYIQATTRAGYALHFPILLSELVSASSGDVISGPDTCSSTDGTKMNIWSDMFAEDMSPLVQSCPCDTCLYHTRAYIHHLLVTHEMTAQVLLEQHNILRMQLFLQIIRRHIREGTLKEYMDAWMAYQLQWQKQF